MIDSDSDEWIIVQNDKGTVKISTCEDDETRLYEKTRDWIVTEVDDDDDNSENLKFPKNIAKFFISDLLNSKLLPNGSFVCKGLNFSTVFLCGNIVNKHNNNDYNFLDVDDGTSSIRCIISNADLIKLKRSNVSLASYNDWLSSGSAENNVFVKGGLIMMSAINHLQKSVPTFDEIALGDTIKIVGNLKSSKYGRSIFIQRILKERYNPSAFVVYLEDMVHTYKEIYDVEIKTENEHEKDVKSQEQ